MTQEDKDLLLKDLCARLPYGVKISKVIDEYISENTLIKSLYTNGSIVIENEPFDDGLPDIEVWDVSEIKPYLRPMSSMTEEEEIEYDATFATIKIADSHYDSIMTYKSFDWLNAHHFDYRGLIEKGLALEAPNGMYNLK